VVTHPPFENFKILNFYFLLIYPWRFFCLTDVVCISQRKFLSNRHYVCLFIYKNVTVFLTTSFSHLTVFIQETLNSFFLLVLIQLYKIYHNLGRERRRLVKQQTKTQFFCIDTPAFPIQINLPQDSLGFFNFSLGLSYTAVRAPPKCLLLKLCPPPPQRGHHQSLPSLLQMVSNI